MRLSELFSTGAILFTLGTTSKADSRSQVSHIRQAEIHEVTSEVFESFQIFSQYAAAAYCRSVTGTKKGSVSIDRLITCVAENCPLVERSKASVISVFAPNRKAGKPDIRGFVAVDPIYNVTIVSYRGTSSSHNMMSNYNFRHDKFRDFPPCKDCTVHFGMMSGFKERLVETVTAIKQAKKEHPHNRLVFTGHSLGGAVATIMGTYLREFGYPSAEIWTFGSPRIGNKIWAKFVTNQQALTYRMTHLRDPVPRLPPSFWPFNYKHNGPEYWLGPGGTPLTHNYNRTDITICNGVEPKGCIRDQSFWPPDSTSHRHYLANTTACSRIKPRRDGHGIEEFPYFSSDFKTIGMAEQSFADGTLTEREAFIMANETLKISDADVADMSEISDEFEVTRERSVEEILGVLEKIGQSQGDSSEEAASARNVQEGGLTNNGRCFDGWFGDCAGHDFHS